MEADSDRSEIKLVALALVSFFLPSGVVLAFVFWRYLDLNLKMLEDRRYRQLEQDVS